MKFLKKFDNYTAGSERYGDILTEEEFNDLYEKYCKNHKNSSIKLYRGVPKTLENFYYQNPKGHIRKSIEEENIHVILMSELESWEDFPPYNQSIIGSTNYDSAKNYGWGGTCFEIIPFDDTKIGICDESNIWESFGGFSNFAFIRMTDRFLNDLIGNVKSWKEIKEKILNSNLNDVFFDLSEDSLTFLNYVLEFKTNPNSNYIQNLLMDKKFSDEINSEYIEKIEPDDIIIFIEKLFEPNNFTYLKYDENFSSNIKDYDYSQIWCGGPVLLRKI
ncbi:hypothetical protein M0Q97_09980 [Candidatus Dojkabacteria bacterium]|jgi:hypothetical protein|nr:hypothetical protein [Candidatus Dojkabacteria bacterium]